MARIYANLVQFGRRNFSDVYPTMKDATKAELQRRVRDGEMSQSEYDRLIVL